jgi:hypothetical protein
MLRRETGQARNSEQGRSGFDCDSWCSSAGLRSGPASAEVERQRRARGTKRHPKRLDLSDSTKPSWASKGLCTLDE